MAITLGGSSGGGAQIGDVKYIANGAAIITTASGEKWQRSAITSNTDTTTYPDAPLFYGTISTAADTQVDKSNTSGSNVWYSTAGRNKACTNGEYIWTGRHDGNHRIYKWHFASPGTINGGTAYAGTFLQWLKGGMCVHAHSDGKFYSAHTVLYNSSYSRILIEKYTITSTGSLTLDSSHNLNDYTRGGTEGDWVRANGYEDRMWMVAKNGSTITAALIDLTGNYYTSENIALGSANLTTAPYAVRSVHMFNNKYVVIGDRGDGYIYTLDWTFVKKVSTGIPNNMYCFSKTDTTSADLAEDSYGGIGASVSGVHNYQRIYELTTTGYKNRPPEIFVGVEEKKSEGFAVNQYVRIA